MRGEPEPDAIERDSDFGEIGRRSRELIKPAFEIAVIAPEQSPDVWRHGEIGCTHDASVTFVPALASASTTAIELTETGLFSSRSVKIEWA